VDNEVQYSRLVLDALSYKYPEGTGCFRWDGSCRKLNEIGPSTLPIIEATILREVLPAYHCSSESLERKFPGLSSLLVTYFGIDKDTASERSFQFFQRLCGSVRVEAMRAINIAWLCRAPTAPIPEPLKKSIEVLAADGSGEIKAVASWLVERAAEHGK
jgi:hypothetical protein